MRFRLLIFFFAINSIAVAAYAQSPIGANSKAIVSDLLEKNIQQVGDLDLKKLQQEIGEVKWELSDEHRNKDAINRRSARYFPAEKKVQIFSNYDTSFKEQTAVLELHEALGALGYKDQDYSQSVSLDHVSKMKDPIKRDQLIKAYGGKFFKKDNLKIQQSGGSSVGGGGDLTSVILKSLILKEIDMLEDPDMDFYLRFATMTIEPVGGLQHFSDNKPRIFFELNMQRSQEEKSGVQERVIIHFPGFIKFPGTRLEQIDSIIIQIAARIVLLYPVSKTAPLVPVSVNTCVEEKTLYYPESESPGISYLQKERTEFLVGCGKYKDRNSIRLLFNWPCL